MKKAFVSLLSCDHETKIENSKFKSFCENNGIFHNSSSLRTPQQNGVVKRKIELCKRWLEPCYMKIHFLSTFEQK